MVEKIEKRDRSHGFLKNIGVLLTGTGIAQILPIAMMPVLTRFYSPEEFGIWAIYVALVAIVSVIVAGRYELAVMMPRTRRKALDVFFLSLVVVLGSSVLLLLVVALFGPMALRGVGYEELGQGLYLVPLGVGLAGALQAFTYWNNRNSNFTVSARAKVVQASGMVLVQLALAVVLPGIGLIVGMVAGSFAAVMYCGWRFWKERNYLLRSCNRRRLCRVARDYSQFPLYSSMGALLDSAALQAPVLFISRLFDTAVAGVFGLTFRALSMPSSLISGALSQVLYQKVVKLCHDGAEGLHLYIFRLFIALCALAVPAVVILHFYGEPIFVFVFGEAWRQAGQLSQILVFAVGIRFAVSPLSSVLLLKGNLRLGFVWQAMYFCTLMLVLWLFRHWDVYRYLAVFAVHELVLYLLYLVFILAGAKRIAAKEVS
ncbi:lipopolysaccharide biosynthesis protein [Kerstersia similis]|uniref:lipopolysaccharide biosynthesis protein n=1 Tax=Kerstersia similis TaxID=206505 RepID=UPI0039F02342